MTKLFSVKSLAFAGAAAFAVALAAAPQADAAEKLTVSTASLGNVTVIEGEDGLSTTEDGVVIYYQTGKDASKIKDGKYTAITDENLGYFNFSKFEGKATYLSISPDGTLENATGVAIKAAPKVSAKYTYKDGLKITIDKQEATIISTASGITIVKAGDKEYSVAGASEEAIKSNSVLGGTLTLWVNEIAPTDGIASTGTAKLKIAAKAKAPKVSLKLNATKAFTWKITNKQEYLVQTKDTKGAWTDGSGTADTWADVIKKSSPEIAKAVSGDAITADISISLRTKGDTKAPSAINLIKINKSADSPTSAAVSIKFTDAVLKADGSVKTATAAAIEAKTAIQYSLDGTTWKALKASASAKLTDTTKTKVYVRIPGTTTFVLPSLNTQFALDFNAATAAASYFTYDSSGEVVLAE